MTVWIVTYVKVGSDADVYAQGVLYVGRSKLAGVQTMRRNRDRFLENGWELVYSNEFEINMLDPDGDMLFEMQIEECELEN